jgi:hypothetical protein
MLLSDVLASRLMQFPDCSSTAAATILCFPLSGLHEQVARRHSGATRISIRGTAASVLFVDLLCESRQIDRALLSFEGQKCLPQRKPGYFRFCIVALEFIPVSFLQCSCASAVAA